MGRSASPLQRAFPRARSRTPPRVAHTSSAKRRYRRHLRDAGANILALVKCETIYTREALLQHRDVWKAPTMVNYTDLPGECAAKTAPQTDPIHTEERHNVGEPISERAVSAPLSCAISEDMAFLPWPAPKATFCIVDDATLMATAHAACEEAKRRRTTAALDMVIEPAQTASPEHVMLQNQMPAPAIGCQKCALARVCADAISSCICGDLVCTKCLKLGEQCGCDTPSFLAFICEGCNQEVVDDEGDIACLLCKKLLDACPCLHPLMAQIPSLCVDDLPHQYEPHVRWILPSERMCFECQRMIPYKDQENCEVHNCRSLLETGPDNPIDDCVTFHASCLVEVGAGRICRRCNDAGLEPSDGEEEASDNDGSEEVNSEESDHQ